MKAIILRNNKGFYKVQMYIDKAKIQTTDIFISLNLKSPPAVADFLSA
jgi:hypothetical protein